MPDELDDVGTFLDIHLAETNGQRNPEEDFWESRAALQHIRQFAYSRMCSPWAVLGMAMLHALHRLPPWVRLPAIIGGVGSLNSFVALVGPSGSGKGAAEACAAEAFDMSRDGINTVSVGSGEGIVHQYAHWEGTAAKGECVQHTRAVLFTVPEVDQLGALKMRTSSTLLSQLRAAWMGEQLGFAYANAEKRIMVGRHQYRLGMAVGVQPLRASVLLEDADSGTPQRFLWLPSTDPGITADTPPSPRQMFLQVTQYSWEPEILPVPEEAVWIIKENRAAQNRGDRPPLDGHALFARLKAAQALAILDDRKHMDIEDWKLAGFVMAKSDFTRSMVVTELGRKDAQTEMAKALSVGRTEVVKVRMVEEEQVTKTCQAVLRRLDREWRGGAEVRRSLKVHYRPWFEDAVETLQIAGDIEVQEIPGQGQPGIRLRRGA